MDFVNKLANSAQNQGQSANEQVMQNNNEQSSGSSNSGGGGGFLGGLGNKINEAAGGGPASEKNEDYLDKGMYSYHYNC